MVLVVKSGNNTSALKNLMWMKRVIMSKRHELGEKKYKKGMKELQRVQRKILNLKRQGYQVRQFEVNL